MGSRRKARIIALQILYDLDCTEHKAEESLARLATEKASPQEILSFSEHLIQGVLHNKSRLDNHIEHFAPAFPVEQMSIMIKPSCALPFLKYCSIIRPHLR